jgi:hypothetical protein
VWRRPDGTLVDITPKTNHAARIVFLPDPERAYDFAANRRTDNKRKSLCADPDILEFFEFERQVFEYEEANTIAGGLDFRVDAAVYYPLQLRKQAALMRLFGKYLRPSDLCVCWNGQRARDCHLPQIRAIASAMLT